MNKHTYNELFPAIANHLPQNVLMDIMESVPQFEIFVQHCYNFDNTVNDSNVEFVGNMEEADNDWDYGFWSEDNTMEYEEVPYAKKRGHRTHAERRHRDAIVKNNHKRRLSCYNDSIRENPEKYWEKFASYSHNEHQYCAGRYAENTKSAKERKYDNATKILEEEIELGFKHISGEEKFNMIRNIKLMNQENEYYENTLSEFSYLVSSMESQISEMINLANAYKDKIKLLKHFINENDDEIGKLELTLDNILV